MLKRRLGEKIKMHKKLLIGIAVLAMLPLMILPVNAWVYPLSVYGKDSTHPPDLTWEEFGPRIDRIFVKMYNGQEPMWVALAGGEIDMTDWPLNLKWYTAFMNPPYCDTIQVATYPWTNTIAEAGERGSYLLYFNHNNYPTLGPPGPTDPNPVYPCATNVTELRQAISYLLNRTWMETEVLKGLGIGMYTVIPPYMDGLGWMNRDIFPGHSLEALCYLYNPAAAAALLNTGGFPIGPDGWRYWDKNKNGVKDAGEDLTLIMWVRNDHEGRYKIGTEMAAELQKDPIKVHVELNYGGGGKCYVEVMLNKRFHMYTAGWIFIGPEPDFTYDLWHSSMYWHDPESSCPNTDRIEDPILDALAEGVKFGTSMPAVNASCWDFQVRFAQMAHELPLYCNLGVKAYSNTYVGDGPTTTGPEDVYEGEEWWGVVNEQGFGVNSWWTFLDAHPSCHPVGDGTHMTMRYGWSSIWYPTHLNILYAEWYWDYEVLNKIYDSLGMRDPNNLSHIMPWLVKTWQVGTWVDPSDGKTKSKILLTLRSDVFWTDGTPMTAADVAFTFVECLQMLQAKGYATPWWYPAVQYIKSFYLIDPCNIEILFDMQSAWVEVWTLIAVPVIPKHIWKPIIESGDPSAFQPDPAMIGTGPFKFKSFVEMESLEMVANTNYFRYVPKDVNVNTMDYLQKVILPHNQVSVPVTVEVTDHNLITQEFKLESVGSFDPANPVNSEWHGIWPPAPPPKGIYSCPFRIIGWIDQNNTGKLDPCDVIKVESITDPGKELYFHVTEIIPGTPTIITIKEVLVAKKWVYLDGVPVVTGELEYEKPCHPIVEEFTWQLEKGVHNITVVKHIENNWTLCKNNNILSHPYYCRYVKYQYLIWVTSFEDCGGSTFYDDAGLPAYPFKSQLPTPDIIVDIADIYSAALAYGSYPGHPRWNSVYDFVPIPHDYYVDISDIYAIALAFGQPKP